MDQLPVVSVAGVYTGVEFDKHQLGGKPIGSGHQFGGCAAYTSQAPRSHSRFDSYARHLGRSRF